LVGPLLKQSPGKTPANPVYCAVLGFYHGFAFFFTWVWTNVLFKLLVLISPSRDARRAEEKFMRVAHAYEMIYCRDEEPMLADWLAESNFVHSRAFTIALTTLKMTAVIGKFQISISRLFEGSTPFFCIHQGL